MIAAYLDALARQAGRVREALPGASFARLAVGGGTPTALDVSGLERLFDLPTGERTLERRPQHLVLGGNRHFLRAAGKS